MDFSTLIGLIITIVFGVPSALTLYYKIDKDSQPPLSGKDFVKRSLIGITVGISMLLLISFFLKQLDDAPEKSKDPQKLLTQCTLLNDSNNGTPDVCIGDWEDTFGNVYPGSIRFWVVRGPGFAEREEISYQIDKTYSTLSGEIVADCNSASDAVFSIHIYLDGDLAYQSTGISATAEPQIYSIDVSNGSEIRIVCTTSTSCYGYCIVSAELS